MFFLQCLKSINAIKVLLLERKSALSKDDCYGTKNIPIVCFNNGKLGKKCK